MEYSPEQQETYRIINGMWQEAIDVQSACNLSGVVHAYAKILSVLCKTTQSTNERNRHPVCVLFSSKIASLTGSEDTQRTADAYTACVRQAELSRQTA